MRNWPTGRGEAKRAETGLDRTRGRQDEQVQPGAEPTYGGGIKSTNTKVDRYGEDVGTLRGTVQSLPQKSVSRCFPVALFPAACLVAVVPSESWSLNILSGSDPAGPDRATQRSNRSRMFIVHSG